MNKEIKKRITQINSGVVPEGYKKTKVGIVPKEWIITKFGEVATGFDYGLNAAAKEYDNINKYIRITDIDEDSRRYNYKEVVSPDCELNEEYVVKKNDILFARTGASTGKTYLYNENDGKLYFAGFLIRANVNNQYNSYFIYSQTLIERYNNWVKIFSMRSGQPGINAQEYKTFELLIPPLPEQQKIAEILSAQDKLIELKQKLIDLKKQQKKWLMQSLLTGKKRLKGFSNEWKKVEIRDCGEVITGNTPPTKDIENYGEKYVWVTPSDISNSVYISMSNKRLSDIGIKKARRLKKGTVLVTCIASIGKNAILDCDGSCNQQINAVILNSSFNNCFFYYLISYNETTLKKNAGKSATQIISKEKFSNLVFKFPPLEEQTAIAEILTQQDKEIELLEKELELQKQKKKALLQLLLTGKVRVI